MDLALTDKMKASLKKFVNDRMCQERKLPAKTVEALLKRKLIFRLGEVLILTYIGGVALERINNRETA